MNIFIHQVMVENTNYSQSILMIFVTHKKFATG